MTWGILLWGAIVIAALYSYGLHRPQGDAPPTAPTIAEWNALPPDAPFTYQVTEIFAGDSQADDEQNAMPPHVKPLAINNAAQVVGEVWQRPATTPAWVRRLLHLPYLSYFNHLKYPNTSQTAFYWDKGLTDTLPYPEGTLTATARFINDSGQIAGEFQTNTQGKNAAHAVLWKSFRAAPRDIGASFSPLDTQVFGFNGAGQIGVIARGVMPDPNHAGSMVYGQAAYLWDNGTPRLMARGLSFYGWQSPTAPRDLQDGGAALLFLSDVREPDGGVPVIASPDHPPVPLPVPEGGALHRNRRGELLITKGDNGSAFYQNGTVNSFWPANLQLDDRSVTLNQNGDAAGLGIYKGDAMGWTFLWRKNRLVKISNLLGPVPEWEVDGIAAMNERGQILGMGHRLPQTGAFTYGTHVLVLTPVLPKRQGAHL